MTYYLIQNALKKQICIYKTPLHTGVTLTSSSRIQKHRLVTMVEQVIDYIYELNKNRSCTDKNNENGVLSYIYLIMDGVKTNGKINFFPRAIQGSSTCCTSKCYTFPHSNLNIVPATILGHS